MAVWRCIENTDHKGKMWAATGAINVRDPRSVPASRLALLHGLHVGLRQARQAFPIRDLDELWFKE